MSQNADAASSTEALAMAQGASHNSNSAAQASAIFQGVVNVENNNAEIAWLIPLQRFLNAIVGLTPKECVAVAADWYEYFMDFENIQWDNIENFISGVTKINLNIGGFSILSANEKRIQALALWVNDSLRIRRVKV